MSNPITTKDIVRVVEKKADVRVQTTQVKMLTELLVVATKSDVKTALLKYIEAKEKELGI